MSLSGLNSGLYEQIRRYAELTDQALIELKTETATSKRENRERLGKLLSRLDSERHEDLSARLLWFILRDSVKIGEQDITRLGTALLGIERHESIIHLLEKLAQTLAQEQAIVKSRMRSSMR